MIKRKPAFMLLFQAEHTENPKIPVRTALRYLYR